MLTWILTCCLIAGFAAAAMELFREIPSTPCSAFRTEHDAAGAAAVGFGDLTQTMTDADLDRLMEEFSLGGEDLLVPDSQGSF